MGGTEEKTSNRRLFLVGIFALILFALDYHVPLGVAMGGLYVLPIVAMTTVTRVSHIHLMAAFCTLLTLVAFFLTYESDTSWKVVANRMISLICIWAAAIAILRYKKLESDRQVMMARHEADLRSKNQVLEVKNKELQQFAYVASHDLQEPLRTITNFTDMLSDEYAEKISGDGITYIEYVQQASDRMSVLIKSLLDYSRIGREREIRKLDCNQVMSDVIEDMDSTIRQHQAQVDYGELPYHLPACEVELRQLFQNLISNAIKFTQPNTQARIHISVEEKPDSWVFCVADNGIGMEPKQLEKIFVIFKRLHTQSRYPGTGIGLANCRKIVELHNGEIWAESEPGQGSRFFFSIPKMDKQVPM